VYELLDAEDSVRGDILSDLSKRQLSDVAKAANRYPNVDCEHKVTNASQIFTSSTIDVEVNVSREWEFGDSVSLLPPVNCSRYPIPREESWWVVVGDEKDNRLCAIKRVNLVKSSKVKLSFASPSEEGKRKYALYFMCDSYLGADLEFEFDVAVAKGEDEEEEDDSSEEEEEEEDEDVNEDDAGKEKDAPDAVMKD
jgi:pre-mRNA-splicing helicase BRR2